MLRAPRLSYARAVHPVTQCRSVGHRLTSPSPGWGWQIEMADRFGLDPTRGEAPGLGSGTNCRFKCTCPFFWPPQYGKACGGEGWQVEMADRLGLDSTLRDRGRPRKR